MRISFKDKRVLITGASMGIGKALAEEFAKRGAHLALGALPSESEELKKVAASLEEQHGIQTWCFAIDLLDADGPERLFEEVSEQVGDIYALVNNAGMAVYGNFWEAPWDPQDRTLRLNLLVPARLMHLFLPGMVERRDGVVFNISSVAALQPTPFHTVYGATKAGLQSLSQGVRAELHGSGVTICTLNPPYTDTNLLKAEGFPSQIRWYTLSGIQTPEWIARKALGAFEGRKFMYVPGIRAWLTHVALGRLSPRWLTDALARYFLKEAGN